MGGARAGTETLALACERFGGGLLGQPANTLTSLAFVLAGVAVLAGRRPAATGLRWRYGLLVVAVGLGSAVQHGPHPPGQAFAHDLPLATLLGFVAAALAADLTGRRWLAWTWLPVPVAMVPAVAAGPVVSTLAQGGLAALAIGLGLVRARRRPDLRRALLGALGLLGAGALIGSLTDRAGLCQPDSLLQGHAAWHLLAAAALWWLAPAIGAGVAPVPGAGGAVRPRGAGITRHAGAGPRR